MRASSRFRARRSCGTRKLDAEAYVLDRVVVPKPIRDCDADDVVTGKRDSALLRVRADLDVPTRGHEPRHVDVVQSLIDPM